MPTFVPRALVQITATLSNLRTGPARKTSEIAITAVPLDCEVVRSPTGIADSASVTLQWDEVAIDPRAIADMRVVVYLADVEDPRVDLVDSNTDAARFAGFVDEPALSFDSRGGVVMLSARSYEGRLLDTPAPAARVRIDRPLAQVLRELVTEVPGYDRFPIVVDPDITPSDVLGRKTWASEERASIWDAITALCNQCGLVVGYDIDTLTVTEPRPETSDGVPVMIWGENLDSVDLRRDLSPVQSKAIRLYCLDDIRRRRITARWPKRRRQGETEVRLSVVGAYDQRGLERYARVIHQAWNRQQVIGRLTTRVMRVADLSRRAQTERIDSTGESETTSDGTPDLDLCALRSGDRVYVNVRGFTPTSVFGFTAGELYDYLLERRLDEREADELAAAWTQTDSLAPQFNVSEARHRWSRDRGYRLTVDFEGLVSVSTGDEDG